MNDTLETNTFNCEVDISLLNNPSRLRERADAIDAWNAGNPVDKYIDGQWIQIEEQTAFFFDRRYRARPVSETDFSDVAVTVADVRELMITTATPPPPEAPQP